MRTVIEKAKKGNRLALTQLYEENKQYVEQLCCLLLCDIKAADKAVVKTFEDVFSNLVSKRSNEDDIRALLTKKAVNACRSTILHKNKKAFNIPIGKNFAGTVYDPKKILTDGDACDQILANLPPLHRFIYVLHAVAELSDQKIAEFLNVSLENVSDALDAEEANVNRITLCIRQKTSEQTEISVDMLAQLMIAQEHRVSTSKGVDSVVLNAIDKIVTPIEQQAKKRNMTIITIAVACLLVIGLIVTIVVLTAGDDDTDYTSGDTGTTDTADGDDTADDSEEYYTYDELDADYEYYADIELEGYGTITVLLDPESAPQSAANFVYLAESEFYDGLTFHRIVEGFMMQGGDPYADGTGGSDNNILGEFSSNGVENNLSHTAGAISMARSSDYNSASSQFFIVHEDSTSLDGDYAVFGYVIEGMEIVDQICTEAGPTDEILDYEDQPVITTITIRRVEIVADDETGTEAEESDEASATE